MGRRLALARCLALGGALYLLDEPFSGVDPERARRILLRVPQTRFQSLEKLPGHPDWPEAARHTRRFIQYRLDRPPRLWPELPQGGESPSRDDGNA